MTAPPISLRDALGDALLAPGISAKQLEAAGEFILTDYPGRLGIGSDQRIMFGVLPIEGDLAGIEHLLALKATEGRDRIAAVVREHGRVGPCILTRRRLDAVTIMWEFAERRADGSTWSPLAGVPEYQRDRADTYLEPEPI